MSCGGQGDHDRLRTLRLVPGAERLPNAGADSRRESRQSHRTVPGDVTDEERSTALSRELLTTSVEVHA